MPRTLPSLAVIGVITLGACAVVPPPGPSVMAVPAQGISFAQFQQDDVQCRQYAAQQTGYGTSAQAANDSAVGSAVLGTAVGAAAGAALGAVVGNPGLGAAIGAGSGLLLGSSAGVANANASGAAFQQRYDMAYVQCMTAKGESVPSVTPVTNSRPGYPVYSEGSPYYPSGYSPRYYYGPPVVGGVYVPPGPRWGYHSYPW
ncbi:MAG: glycine zipper family protein [Rhodospirillaceae bacterium]